MQGLEDAFDGANRKDAHQLIFITRKTENDEPLGEQTVVEMESSLEDESYGKEKYFIRDHDDSANATFVSRDDAQSMLQLARLPTCAVFHRLTAGKGIPHSFAGFIRQWPALPRVVVSFYIAQC